VDKIKLYIKILTSLDEVHNLYRVNTRNTDSFNVVLFISWKSQKGNKNIWKISWWSIETALLEFRSLTM